MRELPVAALEDSLADRLLSGDPSGVQAKREDGKPRLFNHMNFRGATFVY
jgi:hypothetical protein